MDFISPSVIKRIASKYGFVFKKGLGQNFLSSQDVLEEIAIAAEIDDSGVIEIGPGFGCLQTSLQSVPKRFLHLKLMKDLFRV